MNNIKNILSIDMLFTSGVTRQCNRCPCTGSCSYGAPEKTVKMVKN